VAQEKRLRRETGDWRLETGDWRLETGDGRWEMGDGETRVMADKVGKFEDLEVWKESMRLAVSLYGRLKDCNDFGLRDQMQRAAVSIPSNIAEGYERNSNKEFIQYLHIAKGSCAELRTQLHIASQAKILGKTTCDELLQSSRKISAMLFKLIKCRRDRF
jgi:four helix bundle protein